MKDTEHEALIDAVIEQMKLDIEAQDWTAIAEMLAHSPKDVLIGFLPEEAEAKAWKRVEEDAIHMERNCR